MADCSRISAKLAGSAFFVCAGLVCSIPAAYGQTGPSHDQRSVIEEVTVTARRREERLIDTPVAISVLSHEAIERYNTRDLISLTDRMPGLDIVESGGGGAGGNINVRGIGQPPGTSDYGMDQPVSIVIDGMPFSRGHMLKTGFFDVEAVELLKGPQALYYGKNSPGGVLGIRSRTPEVGGEREFFIRGQYEFVAEDPTIEAGISLPVGDHLAFRLAARRQDMQGGWMKNNAQPLDVTALWGENFETRGASHDDFPGQDQWVVRLTSVWEPTAGFSATLRNFVSRTERNDAWRQSIYACADGPGGHPHYTAFPDTTQTCPDFSARLESNGALPPREIANADPFSDEDNRLSDKLNQSVHTLELTWDIADFRVTSISGYWDYTHREFANSDHTSYAVVFSNQGESGDAFTQELRIESDFDGPINFMAGAFYETAERTLDAPVHILPAAFFPPGDMPYQAGQFPGDEIYDGSYLNYHQRWDNDIETYSVFGSVDWRFAERWELSGGLRYTKEKRKAVGGNLFENSGFLGFSPSGVMYEPSISSSNVSPEATLTYHVTDDIMVYGSYKTGFQSAGVSNPGTVPDLTGLTPEQQNDALTFDEMTIEGFEVGMKGDFLDRRLRADLTAFWYEAEDLQVGIFNANTTTFTIQNAAVAHNWGLEAQAEFYVNDSWQLRFSSQYNNLKYDEWEDAGCHSVDNALPFDVLDARTGPGCHIGPEGAPIQDLSGQRYGGPPLQANFGVTYRAMVLANWALEAHWDTMYKSKGKRVLNQPFTEVPSRTVSHLSASLRQQDGPWRVGLVCSNCFNKVYAARITNKALGKINPGESGDLLSIVGTPRLVTAQITYEL